MMIERIKLAKKEIVLVGTAHISKESITLVEKTIEKEKPDVIGVELDKDRLHQLLSGKKWQEMNIVEVVKTGKTNLFLLSLLLSNMQKQIGKSVGINPGAEMLAAVKIAQIKKIPIQLLDRNVNITLKRAFNEMSLKEKVKLGYSLFASFFGVGEKITPEKIEELKKEDIMNNLMKELGKQMPSMKKVLVDERDLFISESIITGPGKKIVAIVGAGHLKGIKSTIESGKKINISTLLNMPKKKNYLKYLKYIIPIVFIGLMGYAIYSKGLTTTIDLLIIWFLINGTFSAIGAFLARAHPISIITAFFAAPFTSLHPAFAAGWFAALSETKYNPPKVMDFETLSGLNNLKEFYNNKVTHILIVAAFTNIGSIIGTIIALPTIISILA
jgi:pheromone shutdown-related protein TraB